MREEGHASHYQMARIDKDALGVAGAAVHGARAAAGDAGRRFPQHPGARRGQHLKVVGVLVSPKNIDAELVKRETLRAARPLGLELIFAQASTRVRRRDLLSLALAVTLISRAHAQAPKPRLA